MVLRVRWRAGCLVTSSIPLKRGHDEYQITTRSLAVLKNLVNSFRKGTRWTRQITGSVDLSEMDCIARRHASSVRDHPERMGTGSEFRGAFPPFLHWAQNHARVATLIGGNRSGWTLTEQQGHIVTWSVTGIPWHLKKLTSLARAQSSTSKQFRAIASP